MTENPYVDFHSHLVPGVDDGARTMDDALYAVGQFAEAGFGRLVTTPHVDGSLSLDPPSLELRLHQIRVAWGTVMDAARARTQGIQLALGAEVMLSSPGVELSNPGLRLDGGDFALVEWPGLQVPPGSASVLARLVSEGHGLVVAHPERYRGVDPELSILSDWRRVGARLQVNHGSILGWYGARARDLSLQMLRLGWVDYLSSDLHPRVGDRLPLEESHALFGEMDALEQWDLLVRVNPSRLLEGQGPLPVPPIRPVPGILGRVKRLFQGRP